MLYVFSEEGITEASQNMQLNHELINICTYSSAE